MGIFILEEEGAPLSVLISRMGLRGEREEGRRTFKRKEEMAKRRGWGCILEVGREVELWG